MLLSLLNRFAKFKVGKDIQKYWFIFAFLIKTMLTKKDLFGLARLPHNALIFMLKLRKKTSKLGALEGEVVNRPGPRKVCKY